MHIKICGMVRMKDIEAVNLILPDFAGFIFATSRRQVDADTARNLVAHLRHAILPVGVFVDEMPETVVRIAERCGLRVVQLHGDEDMAYIARLRSLLPRGIMIWRAIRVRDAGSLQPMALLSVDRFLLDAWHPKEPGGAGAAFDWNMARLAKKSFMLAGGLNPQNVAEAIRTVRPWGVDVSSGVETGGWKDPHKMAFFVEAARTALAALQAENT